MKVLVVEDEPIIRLGIVSSIEDAGHEVVEAANADEAVRRLSSEGGVRVIVTDVDMPGSMDGIALALYARRTWPSIGLLVISGKVGVLPSQLPEGARFMSKPYQEPQLISVITALAGGAE
jgi:two-component system, response regulator PdtaR